MRRWKKAIIVSVCIAIAVVFMVNYVSVKIRTSEINSVTKKLAHYDIYKKFNRLWHEEENALSRLVEDLARANKLMLHSGTMDILFRPDLADLKRVVNNLLSEEFVEAVETSALTDLEYASSFDHEEFSWSARRRFEIASFISKRIEMSQPDVEILEWAAGNREKERNYALGVLFFEKGSKAVEDFSSMDAPFLLKTAYDYLFQIDTADAQLVKEEIKKLWPKAHYSRGKYLHKEGYFDQALGSYLNAQRIGFDCNKEMIQVRYDIKNNPDLNKNETGWTVGVAGMTITIDNGKGTLKSHEPESLSE